MPSTPLHRCAENGRPRSARALIEAGADIDNKEEFGRTLFTFVRGNQ